MGGVCGCSVISVWCTPDTVRCKAYGCIGVHGARTIMSKERDQGSGRYVEKATLDDVLDVVDAVDGPPVVTTADVADATGISRDSARRKLETLRENGRVERRKSAGRVLYWPVDDPTPSERRETAERRDHSDDGRDTNQPTADATHATLPDELATLTVDVGRDELAGSGRKLDERIDALQAVVSYLVEHGTATPAEFRDAVFPDHSAHYETPRSWWKNAMYPGLSALAERADAVEPADSSGEWIYLGTRGEDTDDVVDGKTYDPTDE